MPVNKTQGHMGLEYVENLTYLGSKWRNLQRRYSSSQRPYPKGLGIDNVCTIKRQHFGNISLTKLSVRDMHRLLKIIGHKYRQMRLKYNQKSRESNDGSIQRGISTNVE